MRKPAVAREYEEPELVTNDDITHKEVRLIIPSEETGEDVMIGIYPIEVARSEAQRMEKDLVLVNDKADPPICKIVEYSKHKYEMQKKIKENFKKELAKQSKIKEIKMSYKIDIHDLEVRIKAIQKFIAQGDKVRVTVQFQGREHSFYDLGIELLNRMLDQLKDKLVVESPPQQEGWGVSMMVGPKKKAG